MWRATGRRIGREGLIEQMADLTKRARNVLKWLNVSQPSDLAARLKADGWSLEYCLMLAPNCGRKTKSEIAQWYASAVDDPMPKLIWVRIKRDDKLRWCILGASIEQQDGPDWHLAEVATPTAQEET